MIYIIPAAGEGSRFGVEKWGPKPLIQIEGKSLLEYAIRSLPVRNNDEFFFVFRDSKYEIVISECLLKLKIPVRWNFMFLEESTQGQAATVCKIISSINPAEPVVIHNCDTAMTFDNDFTTDCDGLVVLFHSNEPKFSYATLDKDGLLVSTSEKVVISNYASTGTYYFKDIRTFKKYYEKTSFYNGEHFIAPIYNSMIKDGLRVQSTFASEVFPLGTPDDLSEHQERLLQRWRPRW